jgi:N-glycosylase/DNA lyase
MTQLPEPWLSTYAERQSAILARLQDFAAVPSHRHFYELAYCILTPQSSAKNADLTIAELERDQFFEIGFDPTPNLRDPAHYIRFHNVKAKRLLTIRERFSMIESLLSNRSLAAIDLREVLLGVVGGIGMKESSHFLRNVGVCGLAILDRHIFKHLARLGVIEAIPTNAPTKKRYLEIEKAWHEYATSVGISLDELDLLFWSMETGEIRK